MVLQLLKNLFFSKAVSSHKDINNKKLKKQCFFVYSCMLVQKSIYTSKVHVQIFFILDFKWKSQYNFGSENENNIDFSKKFVKDR